MLEIGSYIDGKYKILNKVGSGGSGNVYLAMNEAANKPWAIKEVKKEDKDAETQTIFKNSLMVEVDLMKKLHHKYLPSIVDVITLEDSFLIVMDFVDGKSLDSYLQDGFCPQDKVIEWAKQLCDVLGYLHSREPAIIYRDLKPSNIMLKDNGQITLIDFGAAREFKQSNKNKDTVCLGTPGYAAPEQWGGNGQTDARTDIYCLGATLYHLLTGIEPKPAEMRPIRQINPSLSSGLEDIILKCTQLKPEDRYQSCEEVYYALEHYEELEHSFREKIKQKVTMTGVLAITMVLLGVVAFIFGSLENTMRASNYDAYLAAAEGYSSTEYEKKIKSFQNAINLNPENEKAYISMLQYLISDTEYSIEDDMEISKVLYNTSNNNTTNESEFKKNKKGYSEFAYELGSAYFFYYTEGTKAGKTEAKKWFDNALVGNLNDDLKEARAEIYSRIGGYFATLGNVDITGEKDSSTYNELWRDLVLLGDYELSDLGNNVTVLSLYSEILRQIDENANEFIKNGIMPEELQEEVDLLDKKADRIEIKDNTMLLHKQIDERVLTSTRTIKTVASYQNIGGGM